MAQIAECPKCGVLIDLRKYSNAILKFVKQCPYCWGGLIEGKVKLYNLIPADDATVFNANDRDYLQKFHIAVEGDEREPEK